MQLAAHPSADCSGLNKSRARKSGWWTDETGFMFP